MGREKQAEGAADAWRTVCDLDKPLIFILIKYVDGGGGSVVP